MQGEELNVPHMASFHPKDSLGGQGNSGEPTTSLTRSPYLFLDNKQIEESFAILSTSQLRDSALATSGDSTPLGYHYRNPNGGLNTARPSSDLESVASVECVPPKTVTVKVEVHKEMDDSEQFHLSMASPVRFPAIDHDRKTGVVTADANLVNGSVQEEEREGGKDRRSKSLPYHSAPPDLNYLNSRDQSPNAQDSSACPLVSHVVSSSSANTLSHEYTSKLEANFVKNHFFEETPEQPMRERMTDIIKKGQVYPS